MFDTTLNAGQIASFAKTSAVTDSSVSLTQRMRSYLDANCSHCHRPGGVLRSSWDARCDTPLALQGIVDVAPEGTFGIEGARVIKPGDKDKSLMYIRMNDIWNAQAQMPPLARNVRHDAAMDTLTQWITHFLARRMQQDGLPDAIRYLDQPPAMATPSASDPDPFPFIASPWCASVTPDHATVKMDTCYPGASPAAVHWPSWWAGPPSGAC